VQQHPGVIEALFEELSRADRFVQQQRPQAIKLISDFSGLDAGVVSRFIQRRPVSPTGLLKPETVQDQQRVADAFYGLNLVPKRVHVSEIVWKFAR
jgi:sulfonate transport system substrate-binding protein